MMRSSYKTIKYSLLGIQLYVSDVLHRDFNVEIDFFELKPELAPIEQ